MLLKNLTEILKLLDGELGEKQTFAGEICGLVDIALVPFYVRFYTLETFGNFSIEAECRECTGPDTPDCHTKI